MARMTDQEATELDEKWTNNPPKVGENGTGFFARKQKAHLIEVDDFSSDYLVTKARAENKTPKQIVRELISEQIVKTAV
ncbi:MAG: hypothetical protein LBN36_01980 [Clostridiales Family XIII bacterium]|jgi:hypothetical protein|nr:hypothetical protein [Clostridiales Family XIII bacterium]